MDTGVIRILEWPKSCEKCTHEFEGEYLVAEMGWTKDEGAFAVAFCSVCDHKIPLRIEVS